MTTRRFGSKPHRANAAAGTLPEHTADARPFLKGGVPSCALPIASGPAGGRSGTRRRACFFYDLPPVKSVQQSLFGAAGDEGADAVRMEAVDQVNRQMVRGTVGFASAGLEGKRAWAMQRKWRSPRYTTRWAELPVAQS